MSSYGALGESQGRRESVTARESGVNNNEYETTPSSSLPQNQNTSNETSSASSPNNNNNHHNSNADTNNSSNNNFHSETAVSNGIMAPDQASRAVRFVKWYIGVLFYLRYPLLLTWTLIVLSCSLAAGNLTKHLSEEVAPPKNSPAKIANTKYGKWWPESLTTTSFLVYYDTTRIRPFSLTTSPEFWAFDCFAEYWGTTGRLDFDSSVNTTELLSNMTKTTNMTAYSSWRILLRENFWGPSVLDYLGISNYSVVAAVALDTGPNSDKTYQFYNDFNAAVPTLLAKANLTGQLDVTMIGLPSFMQEIGDASTRDILVMFGIVVPIALIVFCFSLDSLRLGILALCSLISTLLLTFAALDSVAQSTDVTSIAPGVVGALCIALSSDFTYMLVSKFRREVVLESAHFLDDPSGFARGMIFVDPKHVMVMVMACAGRVVFITGLSVAFASCGMIFFPLTTVSSIGIGCLITALMAVIVSLVLTPTLLVTFYRFFASGAEHCEWPNFGKKNSDHQHHNGSDMYSSGYHSVPSSSNSLSTTVGNNNITTTTNNGGGDASPLLTTTATNDPKPTQQISGKKKNGEKVPLISGTTQTPSFTGSFANNNNGIRPTANNNTKDDPAVVTNGDGTQIPIAIPPSLSNLSQQEIEEPMSPTTQVKNAVRAANRANYGTSGVQKDLPLVSLSREAVSNVQVQLRDKRLFYRDFYAFLCQPRVAVCSILIVLGICLYPMTRTFDGEYSNGMEQFVPRDSPLLPAWRSLERNFHFADVFAYHVLIEFKGITFTQLSGEAPTIQGQQIAQHILEIPNVEPAGIESFFYDPHLVGKEYTPADYPNNTNMDTVPVNVNVTSACTIECFKEAFKCQLNAMFCADLTPYCKYRAVIYQLRTAFNTNTPVADLYVRLRVSPTSAEGRQFVKDMRAKLKEIEESYVVVINETTGERAGNVSLYLSGFGSDSYDLVEYANDHIGEIVAILISCAWFIVTAFFFSLGASLRLLISFVFTFFTLFGLATIIFVDGLLESWPVPAGLTGAEKAEAWLVPFCAVALNIATILNYDVQATMRVQQFRHQGIATRSAIVIAAIEGSNEVFVAASMTIISFIGLLFSQVPTMNQLGFYFVVGAFLQGIVFRLFLVAPVMSLFGELNWFPYMQIAQKLEGVPVSFTGPTSEGPLEPGSPYRESLGVTGYSTAHASRNPSLLAPPGATSAIVDNEALIWAARESGLDPRRISTISGQRSVRESYSYYNYDPNNNNSHHRSASRSHSQHHSQQQRAHSSMAGGGGSRSASTTRPGLDFIFSQQGNPTNNKNTGTGGNKQQPPNNSFAGLPNDGKNNKSKDKDNKSGPRPKLARSSIAPGDSSSHFPANDGEDPYN